MAITRSQQARQMLKEGSMKPVEQAGVVNYMPSEMVTVPKIAKSSPDTPTAKLAYITPKEQDILVDLNLYGSLDGKPNRGPGGIPSLEGDFESYTSGMSSGSNKSSGGPPPGSPDYNTTATFDNSPPIRNRIQKEQQEAFVKKRIKELVDEQEEEKAYEPFETLIVRPTDLPGPSGFVVNATVPYRQGMLDRNVDFYRFDPRTRKAREKYGLTAQGYQDYMTARLANEIDAAGNPIYSDDDDDQLIIPPYVGKPTPVDDEQQDPEKLEDPFRLARAFRADGGIMGGLADGQIDEMGRQMYGLGKLVKKVTRGIKKIAKSPIGKAALLYAGGSYLSGMGAFGGLKGAGIFKPQAISLKNLFMGKSLPFKTAGDAVARSGGLLDFIGGVPGAAIIGSSVVAGLTAEQEKQAQLLADETGVDIAEARDQILRAANRQDDFRARAFKAGGGIMRMGYQEGSKEPVAKKTMPLLDMDGMEKDYRETGGFVDMGRMERADDVPARLSKNEFVFTADAVRNAGEGDIDKGAEVMYNMMKNLEAGGEVSEESQGLEGARRMFQTSQRLEEVI